MQLINKHYLFLVLIFFSTLPSFAQTDLHELMDRRDLKISDVENMAEQYFKINGKGQGSGFKQYQRWLYEQKFHLDANGYIRQPVNEWNDFEQAKNSMASIGNSVGPSAIGGIWSELGPSTWNKTSGWNPGNGRLASMAIQPSNQNIIYVGSPGGGLWKTSNGGSTWSPLLEYNSVWMYIYSIAIDPTNPNIVYAGTGNSGNQIIRSTDAGLSWTLLGSGPTGTIRKILIHPLTPNILFACASNGIFRSTNSGSSWVSVRSGTKEDIEFKPGNPNIMYASGSTEVVRSVDGGLTWNLLSSAEGITNIGRTLISVTNANPDVVYICQANGTLFGRMYKSTNSGINFNTTVIGNPSNGTNYFGYNADGTGLSGQATYDMAMCVSPVNADELYIAGIICWKSTNGGISFTVTTEWSLPNTTGYNHADVHGLEFINSTIYSISDGGLYKSTNYADDWIDLSLGLGIRQFYRIASAPTNGNVLTGGAQDNGSVAKQSSGTWVDWLGADGMEGLVSPSNHLNIWGTSQYGQLYKSTNGGNSRTTLSSITGGAWVTPIAIHPTNESILFAGGNAVYKSTNGGSSFSSISGTTITNSLVDIAVAPSDTNTIYASYSSSLYVTTNGGTNWSTYTAPGSITDICVSPSNPAKIWITLSNGSGRVYVSTNNGATFTNITGTLPTITARTIVVDNSLDENIYVGMNIGVYTSSNSNPSWVNMSDNLPLVAINELDLHYSTNKLRVASYGRGIWETSLAATSCSAPSSLLASNITNTSATISWGSVSAASHYTLEYKQSSSMVWIIASSATSATTFNLTGLVQGTVYDFRVKTNCSSSSSYYAQLQFTTTAPSPPCIASYEPNETQSTALLIATNTIHSAGIGASTDIDFYSLNITGYVNFNIILDNLAADYDIQLLNASGTVIATSANGGTNNENMLLSNQAPSTYYIKVYGYNGANSSLQCYDLFVGTTSSSSCITPTNLSTSLIGGTTATFNWTAVSGALKYRIQYRPFGTTSWTGYDSSTTNSYNATGLNYYTNYEWRVGALCSLDSSLYSGALTFTTLPNCPAIAGTTFANPIIVGQAPCSSSPFVNTQINSTNNCFLNNYSGTNNQSSPNIWYKFTLSSTASVELSHCGSLLMDTYIHLLNSSGTQLLSNDDNGPLCPSSYNASLSTTLSAGTYYVVSEGYGTNVGSITTSIKTINPCNSILNLSLFIEGYYDGLNTMKPVMINEGFNGTPAAASNDVDDMIVELRSPSNLGVVAASSTCRLKTNGTASCVFPPMSGSFYIVVRHRNSITTWSKNPVSFNTNPITYNFTNSAASAYNDNMQEVDPGVWALYSGEVNQDENIDLLDLSILEIDINAFQFGYVVTDVNGDGNVDLLDLPLLEININDFIYSQYP